MILTLLRWMVLLVDVVFLVFFLSERGGPNYAEEWIVLGLFVANILGLAIPVGTRKRRKAAAREGGGVEDHPAEIPVEKPIVRRARRRKPRLPSLLPNFLRKRGKVRLPSLIPNFLRKRGKLRLPSLIPNFLRPSSIRSRLEARRKASKNPENPDTPPPAQE
jgi:hypothetical protein